MSDFRKFVTARRPSWPARGLRVGLRLACLPYLAAVFCKNALYDWGIKKPYRSALPIISIGNLSVGGTGKSPTVAWLARWLRARDLRVAILSRGYGALDNGQNDEALELELQFPDVPHLQHWDRIASARLAEEELEMEVLLLDDGFQHRRIDRDLDIVLLDATDPPAARWPLPAGLMREPLTALKRADVVLLTRCDQAPPADLQRLIRSVTRRAPRAAVLQAYHHPSHLWSLAGGRVDLQQLAGKRALAFCGIGNPQSFFDSLQRCGATLLDQLEWPDHHAYQASDVARLQGWVEGYPDADVIVCTMKDWVKLQIERLGGLPLFALAVELIIVDGQSAFQRQLEACISRKNASIAKSS